MYASTRKPTLSLANYTVASAPTAGADNTGHLIFVSNGAAGSAIIAFSDGSNWKRCDTGATIAAS